MSIARALPSIVLFLSCTQPESPTEASWKVKAFPLEECKGSSIDWDPGMPSRWEAYIILQNEKTPIAIDYRGGFKYSCGPDPKGTLEIHYQ
jgi:hypothetical protein